MAPAGLIVASFVGFGVDSIPASYSKSAGTSTPSVTISFPADHALYNAATWTGSITGTTSDPAAVSSVTVGILQWSNDRFWVDSSFSSRGLAFSTATGTAGWHYHFARPPDGVYTVYVQARVGLGKASRVSHLSTVEFGVDTVPPAPPIIVTGPSDPSTDTDPEFTFRATGRADLAFSCELDDSTFIGCTGDADHDGEHVQGQIRYRNLKTGPHCFSVTATDRAGNIGPPTRFCWTVGSKERTFGIAAGIVTLPRPGTSQRLDLIFTNTNRAPVRVRAGAVGIFIVTARAGCSASTNFAITHGLTSSVTIAGDTTSSLAELAIPQHDWPVIAMIETHTNQDACAGATLTLHYSAKAT